MRFIITKTSRLSSGFHAFFLALPTRQVTASEIVKTLKARFETEHNIACKNIEDFPLFEPINCWILRLTSDPLVKQPIHVVAQTIIARSRTSLLRSCRYEFQRALQKNRVFELLHELLGKFFWLRRENSKPEPEPACETFPRVMERSFEKRNPDEIKTKNLTRGKTKNHSTIYPAPTGIEPVMIEYSVTANRQNE